MKYLKNIEKYLLSVISILLITVVFISISSRFITYSVVFSGEVGKYLFIWLCCVGVSAAAKDTKHVRVTWFIKKITNKIGFKKIFWIISQLFFILLSVIMIYLGASLTINHFLAGKSCMGFSFPMFYFTASIPIGFSLTLIRVTQNVIKVLRKGKFDYNKQKMRGEGIE